MLGNVLDPCFGHVRIGWLRIIQLFVLSLAITGLSLMNWTYGQQPQANKQLIVHIDDTGMCHAANEATIKCLESGVTTSASIMMPCSWAPEFAMYAKQHPEYCYGVHFTLNCEHSTYRWQPVAGKSRVPSLVDKDGYMWSSKEDALTNMKAEEVEIELRAQIELALQLGIPISHFDTHMGTVVNRQDLVAIYLKLALEYDKPVLWFRSIEQELSGEYPDFVAAMSKGAKALEQQKLPVLDGLLQFYGGDDLAEREKTYRDALQDLQPGLTLLIIHSAVDGEELKAITGSHLRRNQDYELFSRPEMLDFMKKRDIQLTSWKQLTAELRSRPSR